LDEKYRVNKNIWQEDSRMFVMSTAEYLQEQQDIIVGTTIVYLLGGLRRNQLHRMMAENWTGGQQKIGLEDSRKLDWRTAEDWTGGQQKIGLKDSRKLDWRTAENLTEGQQKIGLKDSRKLDWRTAENWTGGLWNIVLEEREILDWMKVDHHTGGNRIWTGFYRILGRENNKRIKDRGTAELFATMLTGPRINAGVNFFTWFIFNLQSRKICTVRYNNTTCTAFTCGVLWMVKILNLGWWSFMQGVNLTELWSHVENWLLVSNRLLASPLPQAHPLESHISTHLKQF
jgi:hypothetical protein